MKKGSLFVSLLLAIVMMVSLAVPALATEVTMPVVLGDGNLSEKFSPYYYETVYDKVVGVDLTQIPFMVLDRSGNIIMNGIEGETTTYAGEEYTYYTAANLSVEYDEATDIATYTIQIRDDMVFSDGVPVTADDIIFTYYVYLDTSYIGSTTLNSYPIVGLNNYRTQTTDDVYDKYNTMFNAIYEAGADHEWSDADTWTQELQESFWATMKTVWVEDVQAIVDYVYSNYAASYAEDRLGKTAEEVGEEEGLKVALGMVMWGFAKVGEDGLLTGAVTGDTWAIGEGVYPTIEDYYTETYLAYEGDPVAYWDTEQADGTDVMETARGLFIGEWGPLDESIGEEGIPNITGITKVDDYTVQVRTNGYEAPAIYSILGLSIAPMHYYGDENLYDYDNNMFGFPRGDLAIVEAKSKVPLGGGPYKFVSYENKVATLVANENYWKGEPEIKEFQYKESTNAELIPGIQTGTIDVGGINGSMKDFDNIKSINSNGELSGDVITTSLVNNRGYGYIGINAELVRVGDDSFSEASKNLRKGIATVLAVYRDVAYNSYYGDAAAVINYPISNTSWAAPQPTDEGYKVAFSVDVDGNDIYTSNMMAEDKYVVALDAAIGFFKAAGYTWDEASGKFTAAPEGASMTYEITVGAGGQGDHPSFAVITDASNALASIGIELKINDLSDTSILWDMFDANTQQIWAAAWQSGNPDPDMYQIYHSSNVVGKGGTDSNHYNIALDELDELIMAGRQSDDQSYRKSIYKQALDLIVDQAVEIPCYQRQNAIILSTERINIDTVTPAISTWWDWTEDIEAMQMNAAQ